MITFPNVVTAFLAVLVLGLMVARLIEHRRIRGVIGTLERSHRRFAELLDTLSNGIERKKSRKAAKSAKWTVVSVGPKVYAAPGTLVCSRYGEALWSQVHRKRYRDINWSHDYHEMLPKVGWEDEYANEESSGYELSVA
jgi:hypothetical protein